MVTFKLQTTLWSGLLLYSPGEETDAQEENTVLSVAQWEDKGIKIWLCVYFLIVRIQSHFEDLKCQPVAISMNYWYNIPNIMKSHVGQSWQLTYFCEEKYYPCTLREIDFQSSSPGSICVSQRHLIPRYFISRYQLIPRYLLSIKTQIENVFLFLL